MAIDSDKLEEALSKNKKIVNFMYANRTLIERLLRSTKRKLFKFHIKVDINENHSDFSWVARQLENYYPYGGIEISKILLLNRPRTYFKEVRVESDTYYKDVQSNLKTILGLLNLKSTLLKTDDDTGLQIHQLPEIFTVEENLIIGHDIYYFDHKMINFDKIFDISRSEIRRYVHNQCRSFFTSDLNSFYDNYTDSSLDFSENQIQNLKHITLSFTKKTIDNFNFDKMEAIFLGLERYNFDLKLLFTKSSKAATRTMDFLSNANLDLNFDIQWDLDPLAPLNLRKLYIDFARVSIKLILIFIQVIVKEKSNTAEFYLKNAVVDIKANRTLTDFTQGDIIM